MTEVFNQPADKPSDKPAPVEVKTSIPAPVAMTLMQEIDKWFVDHFHDSVVSRHTEVFNHVRAAKDELLKRIKAL